MRPGYRAAILLCAAEGAVPRHRSRVRQSERGFPCREGVHSAERAPGGLERGPVQRVQPGELGLLRRVHPTAERAAEPELRQTELRGGGSARAAGPEVRTRPERHVDRQTAHGGSDR